jgi:uncharacterized membrane protein SirB2
MIHELIPSYKRFVEEQNSPVGEKSLAAKKFLYHVLPYFVETVLSSGIYFVKEYPNHPFSHILLVRKIIVFMLLIMLALILLNYVPLGSPWL